MAREQQVQSQEERYPGTWQQDLFAELKLLSRVLVAVILVFQFAAQLIVVVGSSMAPTLHNGDLLVAMRLHGAYRTGDVVIVHKETAVIQETVVKRIIATGGQSLEIDYDQNAVFVDGVRLNEPYVNTTELSDSDGGDPMLPRGDLYNLKVPEGCVFVMGDNRNHSTDSRFSLELGIIDEGYITGKAVACFFPLGHQKLLYAGQS